LAAVFEKRVGGLMRAVFGGALLRVAAAAAVMGAVCWWLRGVLEAAFGARGLALQLLTGLGPVAAGGVVYLLLCAVLRVPEVAALTRRLRRRPG
jgi:peptidoglycan biosynthesis protein MviN/MurJ (putative lipid II flippase)